MSITPGYWYVESCSEPGWFIVEVLQDMLCGEPDKLLVWLVGDDHGYDIADIGAEKFLGKVQGFYKGD